MIVTPLVTDTPSTLDLAFKLLPLPVAAVALVLVVSGLVVLSRKNRPTLVHDLLRRFGLPKFPTGLALVLGLLWLVLFLSLTFGILWVIAATTMRLETLAQFDPGDLRWFLLTLSASTAALAAVIALPFTLLRTGFRA